MTLHGARTFLALVLLCAAPFSARPARADEGVVTPDEDHATRGVAFRSVGKNREALAEFEYADRLHSTPRTRAQIALAHQALGEWIQAETGIEEALRAHDDPWVARYAGALQCALDLVRGHVASLVVEVDVDGAELVIDAQTVGLLPLRAPLRVERRIVIVEVHAAGYLPSRHTVDLTARPDAREVVHLEPVPEEAVPAPVLEPPPASPVAREEQAGGLTRAAVVSLTGAGVLGVVGLTAWRVRVSAIGAYNDDALCVFGDLTREQRCGHHRSAADVALGLEVGAFIGAGVAAALGLSFLSTSPTHGGRRVGCTVGLGAGVACQGEF